MHGLSGLRLNQLSEPQEKGAARSCFNAMFHFLFPNDLDRPQQQQASPAGLKVGNQIK
jgi:hypothetical protein